MRPAPPCPLRFHLHSEGVWNIPRWKGLFLNSFFLPKRRASPKNSTAMWLIHVEVWQKTTKFCKAIIFQLKKLIKKKQNSPVINLFPKTYAPGKIDFFHSDRSCKRIRNLLDVTKLYHLSHLFSRGPYIFSKSHMFSHKCFSPSFLPLLR